MDKEINDLIINTQEDCAKEKVDLDILYFERDEVINKLSENKRENDLLRFLLNDISSKICKTNGHSFEDWKEIPHKYFGYYVERKCSICGKIEKQYYEEKVENSTLKKVKKIG